MAIYTDISPIISQDKLIGYGIDYDEQAIRNSLLNIFIIQKGEVPGKPQFGNPLNLTVFDLFDFFSRQDMEDAIANEVRKYEPRVTLNSIYIQLLPEYNRIIIQINYAYYIDDSINYDTLEVPYSHNSISYLGGRRNPPNPKPNSTNCVT